jgi:hypothetical protein
MVDGTVVGSEVRCAWWFLPCLAIAGCSFDTAPISSHAPAPNSDGNAPQAGAPAGSGSAERDGGAAPVTMSPPAAPVGGASSTDASAPPAASDAAGAPPAVGKVDAAVDAGMAPEDAAGLGEDLFEPCETVADCSAGLVCYGGGFGYCAQPCAESSDCVDVDGIDFTCSPNDFACRVDCSSNGTSGACPQGLTCVEFGADDGRCLPPGVGGTGDRQLFEPCDLANGDADCVDGLRCYRSADSQIDGPGYCTFDCAGFESVCGDLDPSPAVLECEESRCRFACGDAPCPDGMRCEDIGDEAVCHYPPG